MLPVKCLAMNEPGTGIADRRPAARLEPDPANRRRYDEMQEQFEAAFAALRPIHEALNG